MVTPFNIMKSNIQLTEPVSLTQATEEGEGSAMDVLVDYSKLNNNVFMPPSLPRPAGSNETWKDIGDGLKIGNMFQTRIREMFTGDQLLPPQAQNLVDVSNKMNSRIAVILSDEKKGLRDIFKYKSQRVNPDNGNRICDGGPLAFFEFLFDFKVPSKVKIDGVMKAVSLRTGILELPGPGGSSGQCWKAYDNTVKPTDYATPHPKWDAGERMHCYICDVSLTLGVEIKLDRKYKMNMDCEHLFPFTEGQLFWILYSNAIKSADVGYTQTLLNIQRREYAPVCLDCNRRLKSSVGILKLNDAWMEATTVKAREGLDIVEIDTISIKKIACNPDWDDVIWQNTTGMNYGQRYERLLAVFRPLVGAINLSLKNRGINTPRELSQFLIYKYLSYFDDVVIGKLKVLFIGGESMKKINSQRKTRNGIFSKMINKLSGLVYRAKRRNAEMEGARKRAKAISDAANRKFGDGSKSRGVKDREDAKNVAVLNLQEAEAAEAEADAIGKRVESEIKGIAQKFLNKSGGNITTIINSIKDDIKNNADVDHLNFYSLNEQKLRAISVADEDIGGLFSSASSSGDGGSGASTGGGRKMKFKQRGGAFDTPEQIKEFTNAYFMYLLALNEFYSKRPDAEFIILALKGINNEILINNKASYRDFINENKKVVKAIAGDAEAEKARAETTQGDTDCPEDKSILKYLNELAEGGNKYYQWDGRQGKYMMIPQGDDVPIIDKDTFNISRGARQIQDELARLVGPRQKSIESYLINPGETELPEVTYSKEKWPTLSNYRCLYCAKKCNTPGWSLRYNKPLSVPIQSKIIYTVIAPNTQQNWVWNGLDGKAYTLRFCPTHWRKIGKGHMADNEEELFASDGTDKDGNPTYIWDRVVDGYNRKKENLGIWEEKERRKAEEEKRKLLLLPKVIKWKKTFRIGQRVGLNPGWKRGQTGEISDIDRLNVVIRPDEGGYGGRPIRIKVEGKILEKWPKLLFWPCVPKAPTPGLSARLQCPPPKKSAEPDLTGTIKKRSAHSRGDKVSLSKESGRTGKKTPRPLHRLPDRVPVDQRHRPAFRQFEQQQRQQLQFEQQQRQQLQFEQQQGYSSSVSSRPPMTPAFHRTALDEQREREMRQRLERRNSGSAGSKFGGGAHGGGGGSGSKKKRRKKKKTRRKNKKKRRKKTKRRRKKKKKTRRRQ